MTQQQRGRRPLLREEQIEPIVQVFRRRAQLLEELAKLPTTRELAEKHGVCSNTILRIAASQGLYKRENILDERSRSASQVARMSKRTKVA